MTVPEFGRLAARYDELRPIDDNWRELFEVIVREGDLRGRRVLDVGCGTGRLAAALAAQARVWGVDPTPEMLEVARGRAPGVGFKLGAAEDLPFRDGWFERAVLWLVVHLIDRRRGFAEVRRVLAPGGCLVITTFEPSHFGEHWLNSLFPSFEAIDRSRFPTREQLARELQEAGFDSIRVQSLHQRAALEREPALAKIRGRHVSTFDLIDSAEYETGRTRAEETLPARIEYELHWLIAVAELPPGEQSASFGV